MSVDSGGDRAVEYDVAVVGGGPAGCSVGVFTARYGLDTVVFDRGNSSLRRCAYLENFLGFPAGIDVETFYGLIHDHVEEAGCDRLAEMVETVERTDGDAFVLETQTGRHVTATRVVAAARYDATYLRPLDDAGEMFETDEHGDEVRERFDRDYPDDDGSTPVDGLYVAAPTDAEAQAILSAGHGARVARTLLSDVRRECGYPDALADHWDWVRSETDLSGEWTDRDRWREWFDGRLPDDCEVDESTLVDLRERQIDRRFEAYLSDDEIDRRTRRGQRRLLEHLDDDLVLDAAREIAAEREGSGTTN
ncbi:NAD(P)/FAD-dependent oxidoreductase [Haloprofundus halobius]|uniref:NAD(P)/FAD-dependent oxidoreductase n=1 Tax=Haloprofundus halobius TaxID=2876194 RepID=UPI001CC9C60F|nr:FAD-dependent oxidoreductase [Haloprofundus halobius]